VESEGDPQTRESIEVHGGSIFPKKEKTQKESVLEREGLMKSPTS